MVIALDPRTQRTYAFSQIPCVVFAVQPRRKTGRRESLSQPTPEPDNVACFSIVALIIVLLFCLYAWISGDAAATTGEASYYSVEEWHKVHPTQEFESSGILEPLLLKTKRTIGRSLDSKETDVLITERAASQARREIEPSKSSPMQQDNKPIDPKEDRETTEAAESDDSSSPGQDLQGEVGPVAEEYGLVEKEKSSFLRVILSIGTILGFYYFQAKDASDITGRRQHHSRRQTTSRTTASTRHSNTTARRQRKKGSRRANRQNQVITSNADVQAIPSTAMSSRITEEAQSSHQEQGNLGKTLLVSGDQLQGMKLSVNANEKNDACPICLDSFQKELSGTMCAILPCQHSCCLPCLIKEDEDIDAGRADPTNSASRHKERLCCCCRHPRDRVLESSISELVCIPTIQNRLKLLQGISLQDKRDIVTSLLRANRFVIFKVERALEDMLIGSLSMPTTTTSVQQSIDLTAEEKEQIYWEAQRPVLQLRKELKDAKWAVHTLKRKKQTGPILADAQLVVQEMEQKLFHAIQNCREDTYNRINSRGAMGTAQTTGEVQVDYHSLHVRDAKRKFDDLLLPLLPVLGKVAIITGKGKRSASGTSVLQAALKDHIENYPDESKRDCLRWEPVSTNDGVIRVLWSQR